MNLDHYENEGFLYINTHSNETFVKGDIRDIDMNLICPGVIVPIINPIKEATRDLVGDEHFVTIDSCLPKISHYTSLQKGVKIRIYWYEQLQKFIVSTEKNIYTYDNRNFYLHTVNFDLLDKNLCYYAIASVTEQKLILTNIVDKQNISLAASYNVSEDLAFMYDIDDILPKIYVTDFIAKKIIDEQLDTFENGVLFILSDGNQVEIRNEKYNYYCMLEKPDNMSIYIYFIKYLNKHAEGNSFDEYFNSLHEFMYEYLDFFPEHSNKFKYMTDKLNKYIMAECLHDTDEAKIAVINKILTLDPEELLLILVLQ